QASAQDLYQPHCQLGVLLYQRDKVTPLNNHQLTIVDSDRIGAALSTVQKRDFAEEFPWNDQIKDCVLALFGWRADPDRAGPHGVKARADVALVKYGGALLDFLRYHARRQLFDDRVAKILEERMVAQRRMPAKYLYPALPARRSHPHKSSAKNQNTSNSSGRPFDRPTANPTL